MQRLNTSKAAIRSRELALATEEEIASALGKQGVTNTGRIVTLPLRPTRYINFFEPFLFFTAGDQLVVPIGATHISLPLQEYNQGSGRKENKRIKRLGLTQVQKESYVTLCMCRLTLVWTLAKLPQSYWNADST